MPTTDIYAKLRSVTGDKLLDASLVVETSDKQFSTAAERSAIPQNVFLDDGYAGGLFDANGFPIDAITLLGRQISPAGLEIAATTSAIGALTVRAGGAVAAGITPIFLDDGYAGGSFDGNGYPVSATPLLGGLVGLTGSQLSYQPIFLDDGYLFAVIDAAGGVPYAVSTGVSPVNYDALIPVIDTDGSVRLLSDTTDVKIASQLGAVLPAPKIVGGNLKWIDRQGTTRDRRQFSLSPWAPGTYTRLIMIPMYGQSLAVGISSGALYTTSAIAPGRALMFNGGARPLIGPTWDRITSDDLRAVTDDRLLTLTNLQEALVTNAGETQLSGIAQWLNRAGVTEASSALLLDTFAIGGSPIQYLQKGTKPYANLIRSIERAKAMADYLGVTLEVPLVAYDQGESDYDKTLAVFKAALLQLQSDLSADIAAIMGDALIRPLLCWQPSSWTAPGLNRATANSPRAILDAAITNPAQIKVIGPQYFDPLFSPDGIHKLSQGYRRYGEYAGRAAALVRAGQPTGALYATAASATGTAISVTFNKNCFIDAAGAVTDPGQYGVRLVNTDTNAAIALSSISISGITLTATAASAPAGSGWTIGIADIGTVGQLAGPTAGARSCIRDTSADACADGSAMHNWACHQQIALTIS